MNYLYIAGAPTGPVKIGISRKPEMRVNSLRNASPVRVEMLRCYVLEEWPRDLEQTVHDALSSKRLSGEWFDIGPDEAALTVERCAKVQRLPISTEAISIEPRAPQSARPHWRAIGGGRPPSDDPAVVVTLRVPASVKDGLPKDWRAQAAEFLRGLAS